MIPQKPERVPQVRLEQNEIPEQSMPGAPISTLMRAVRIGESYPPYDYAWQADTQLGAPLPQHVAQVTVTGVPLPGGVPGQVETLTSVHVTLIDIFGQVAHASAPVRFRRAADRRTPPGQDTAPTWPPVPQPAAPGRKRRGRAALLVALVIAALLLATTAGTGLAIAGLLPINLGLPIANPSTSTSPQSPTATFTATATITPTPVPPAVVTVHAASVPVPTTFAALQDQVIRVTAACAAGEQLLSGGYALDGPIDGNLLAIQGSYPSDAQGTPTTAGAVGQAWTAEVAGPPIPQPPRVALSPPHSDGGEMNPRSALARSVLTMPAEITSSQGINLSAYAICLQNRDLASRIVSAKATFASGAPQASEVPCPSGNVATGGGFIAGFGTEGAVGRLPGHSGRVYASFPSAADGGSGWVVGESAYFGQTTGAMLFAVCATRAGQAGNLAHTSFTVAPGALADPCQPNGTLLLNTCPVVRNGGGQATCGSGTLVGGGFSVDYTDTSHYEPATTAYLETASGGSQDWLVGMSFNDTVLQGQTATTDTQSGSAIGNCLSLG